MIYIIYVLSFGFIFLLKYLRTERRRIKSRKELALLVFFPMIGNGNWIYNHKSRESQEMFLPRKWYIWKKMVFQNFWLTILLTIYMAFLLGMDTYYTLLSDGAIKISSGAVLVFENNVDPTLGVGLIFSSLTIVILAFTLMFFLVIVPAIVARSIKLSYKKRDE